MRARHWAKLGIPICLTLMLPASATFHLVKIVELFPGTAVAPNAQYVNLQMFASGQQFVAGHAVTIFDRTGALIGTVTFPGNLNNGANQAKLLIATNQAQSFFGVNADLVMAQPALLAAGGKVCWAGTIDCVAWGNYIGSSTGVGTPFNAGGGGLTIGRAAKRRLDIAGSATVLDAGDDTNNSANDFRASSTPTPRNNAGVLGHVPNSACGSGMLGGLEQCDDGNTTSGDGCSSTCRVEAAARPAVSIANISTTEGDSGTHTVTFTVRLSKASPGPVTYNIGTVNGTAVAGSDYVGRMLFGQSIPAGATSKTFSVTINGDTMVEPNQAFTARLSNVNNANVSTSSATCTIVNDD
jgi:cysteine-rich repeat protein